MIVKFCLILLMFFSSVSTASGVNLPPIEPMSVEESYRDHMVRLEKTLAPHPVTFSVDGSPAFEVVEADDSRFVVSWDGGALRLYRVGGRQSGGGDWKPVKKKIKKWRGHLHPPMPPIPPGDDSYLGDMDGKGCFGCLFFGAIIWGFIAWFVYFIFGFFV